jgi:hypothetical protein
MTSDHTNGTPVTAGRGTKFFTSTPPTWILIDILAELTTGTGCPSFTSSTTVAPRQAT